jgi:hypothetical protein
MILCLESADSGTHEGDAGGLACNNVFAPSDSVTSGAGEIADTLSEDVAIGGK